MNPRASCRFFARGCLVLLLAAAVARAEPFAFVALGCMPYGRGPDSRPAFLRLVAEINRYSPVFTVHLGDILSSGEQATDALFQQRHEDFNQFRTALIYTPGDNEWTDTWSPKEGSHDPLERLGRLRQLFFADERSLGQKPMPLVTQRRDPAYARYVENARWSYGSVVFATVHVVGSSNNRPRNAEEWRERNAADEAWVRAAFAAAQAEKAAGVAFFFQADPFNADHGHAGYGPGFERFLKVVKEESVAFGRPVLLVHADEHKYRLNVGMAFAQGEAPVPNVTRLETFGDQNAHAVLVVVDPESPAVFQCGPLIAPANRLPRVRSQGD